MYEINYKSQIDRVKEMIPLRKNEETFEVFYHDPKTGQLWKSFFPHLTKNEKGPKLLRPEPLPESLASQLTICLKDAETETDATGLAIEYSQQFSRWEEIITEIEPCRKIYSRDYLLLFLKTLGVLDLKEILKTLKEDESYTQVNQDILIKLHKRAKKVYFRSKIFI